MKKLTAQDLRIGNYVMYNGVIHTVLEIRVFNCELRNDEGYNIVEHEEIEPIPLTEDILLKCGFECYEFDKGHPNQYRFKSRLIVIRNGYFYDYGTGIKIEFLHKLQNLYYELGNELKIIL